MRNRLLSSFWALLLLPAFLLASLQAPAFEKADAKAKNQKEVRLTKGHEAQLLQAGIEVIAPTLQAVTPVTAHALPMAVSEPKQAPLLPCQGVHAQFVRYLRASISPQAP